MTLDIEQLAAVGKEQKNSQPVLRLKTMQKDEINRDAYLRNLNEKLKSDYLNRNLRSGSSYNKPILRLKTFERENGIKALQDIISKIS